MTTVPEPAAATQPAGPLFVVGMWRSGTSLLHTLLNQHPQIALMYEGNLPLLWPLFLNGKNKRDWLERWEFWNGALSRHKVDRDAFPSEFPGFAAAMEAVYRQYAGTAHWGCKSPDYFDRMVRLAQEFPHARFVVIFRDPFEICRSIVRAGRTSRWFARRGMTLRALLGYHEMKKQTDRLRQRGACLYELHYEDLVADPQRTLKSVCKFLEIPFDSQMTSLETADRSAIYDAQHHAGVKSKEIFASANREEVLSPSVKNKVQRYLSYWQRIYAGRWPVYPVAKNDSAKEAGFVERAVDAVIYRSLRVYDQAVVLLYCFAPLGLLRLYRGAYGSTRSSSSPVPALGPETRKA